MTATTTSSTEIKPFTDPTHDAQLGGADEHDTPGGDRRPILTLDDLNNPEKFTCVKHVPVLDVHDDPEYGPVDHDLLKLIAKNTNDRAASKGAFAPLSLGHTKIKVVERDGEQFVTKDPDELKQPPIVGYSANYAIDDFNGVPCLHADWYILNSAVEGSRGYPFRSVERVNPNPKAGNSDPSDNFIERVSLLRTPPRRDLGVLNYGCPDNDRHVMRTYYSRDLEAAPFPLSQPKPQLRSLTTPGASPPAQPVGDSPMADMTAPPPAAPADDLKGQIGAILAELLPSALESALAPYLAPDDGGQSGLDVAPTDESQYADGLEGMDPGMAYADNSAMMPPDNDDTEHQQYASDPGGGNTFTPGGCSIGNPKTPDTETTRMQNDSDRIRTSRYERDLAATRTENAELRTQIRELQHVNRTTRYERTLTQLEAEGIELDRAEEMAELTIDSPADFETKREKLIRSRYAKSAAPIRQPMMRTADPEVKGGGSDLSRDDMQKIYAHCAANGVPFSAGKAALGFK